jgi:hypothetical protein
VWGADWAAVVSTSPRDEASAKQVLPWRQRHEPLKDEHIDLTAVGSPVCEWVVPWLYCVAPPAARDRCQSTLQASDTLYVNDTKRRATPVKHPETPHQGMNMFAYGRVNRNVSARQPLPHVCDGSLDEAPPMLDRRFVSLDRSVECLEPTP